MMSRIGLILLVIVSATLALEQNRLPVGRRTIYDVPSDWEVLSKNPHPTEPISFTILLKQNNLEALDQQFHAVSNPQSKEWGNFLTKREIRDLVRPNPEVFEAFDKWFEPVKSSCRIFKGADYIKVSTNVESASRLLQVPFKTYQHRFNNKIVHRYLGVATVPEHLHAHIDFIAGASELFSGTYKAHSALSSISNEANDIPIQKRNVGDDIVVTPAVLKNYYQVPAGLMGTNSTNLQGIAAFYDFFSFGAFRAFEKDQGLTNVNITRIGPDCAPNCDQYESDLDVQYISAMGAGIDLYFVAQTQNYWILQFAEEVADQLDRLPLVFSISYGWSELAQCDIATANCAKLGYNSMQYVTRTNTALKKLGAMGISVLVSDGDDGAASLGGASGNCPIDSKRYCVLGGCGHTSTSCGAFTVKNSTTGELCFFPMGLGSNGCAAFLSDPNVNNAVTDFFNANSNCAMNLENDVEGNPHVYSTCACSSINSIDSNGYHFSPYTFDKSNGPVFTADYPTSSPFVTSVGATQFLSNNGRITQEVGCSILTGAIITTGGGFSAFQPRSDYQSKAVNAWASYPGNQAPPSFSFNTNMRAYPDISFNGHHYKVFFSNDTSDNCPCPSTEVDGTSASSPALSGLITLINDQLLNKGKPQLGFLNYLLYQMYEESPGNFNDIISGDNKCNRAYCCQYGYTAVKGWDPVSGLGSPRFDAMLKYILKKKA